MCAPFALWSSFLHSCKTETQEDREIRAAYDALTKALAGAALDARSTSRENQHLGRRRWHKCTLAFSDKSLEAAFQMYYAHLRSSRMRTGMLVVGSMYIVYAMIMWQGVDRDAELYLRIGYIVFLFSMFITSFTTTWHNWSQLGSLIVASVTLMEAISEACILNNLLAPTTLIINVLFMLAWNIFVRFRFVATVLLCALVGVSFFVVSIVYFREGDSVVAKDDALRYIMWDTGVLLFVAILISKMSHRQEVASRYNFLSNMRKASWTYRNRQSNSLEDVATQAHGWSPKPLSEQVGTNNSQMSPQAGSEYPTTPVRTRNKISISVPSNLSVSVRKHLVGSPPRGPAEADARNIPDFELLHGSEKDTLREDGDRTIPVFSEELDSGDLLHNIFEVFNRMIDTGSSSMARLGSFADNSIVGSGTESLVSFVMNGKEGPADSQGLESKGLDLGENASPEKFEVPDSGRESPGTVHPYDAKEKIGEEKNSSLSVHERSSPNSTTPLLPDNIRGSSWRGGSYCLLSAKELPDWFEPYPFAFQGYRVGLNNQVTVQSIFHCHNETQNIWTEFGPLFAFVIISVWVMQGWEITREAPSMDRAFMLLCLIGCLIVRPLVSGLAHAFAQQSQQKYATWWAADFVSICLAIACSSLLMARFTFYCHCDRQLFYTIGLVGLLTSTIISVISAASPGVRIASFILLVVIANGVPLGWQLYAQFANASKSEIVPTDYLLFWVLALVTMAIGLIIRGCSIPEVCCPGAFDYCGHSHMYWHCCINGGFLLMVFAIHRYLLFRQEVRCDVSSIDWCNNATWLIPINTSSLG